VATGSSVWACWPVRIEAPMTPRTTRLLRHARRHKVRLQQNAPHQFAAGHALAHYPSNSVYTMIPKNACSTMRFTLAIENGCIAGAEDINWIHHNNTTFVASLRELATADYTFVVLRCPFRRLVSCFLDKFVQKTMEFWVYYNAMDRSFDPDALSFRAFVDSLQEYRVRTINIHWRPQSDFLVYEDYDSYFRVEAFDEAVAELRERIGMQVRDARELTRHGTAGQDAPEGSFADTPTGALKRLADDGLAPRPEQFYDEALIGAVRRFYAPDIALYTDRFGASGLLFS